MATIDPNQWIKLLWRVAGRDRKPGESKRELFSAGATGLLAAIRRFDPTDGRAKFSTFAWRYIRWAICQWRAKEREAHRGVVSLCDVDPEDPVFAEHPEPRDDLLDAGATVDRLLREVTPRSSRLLRMKYGIEPGGETLRKRGAVFGISPERVRELETKAELKIRRSVTKPTPATTK